MPAVGWPSNRRFFLPRKIPGVRVRSDAGMRRTKLLIIERNAETSFGAAMGGAIFECERTAVSFGDLPAQNQTDSRASLFGGEKRHKKIRGAGNSRAVVLHPDFDAAVLAFPADAHAAASFERGVHGVVQQVDQ